MAQNPPPLNIIISATDQTRAAVASAQTGIDSLKASAASLSGVFAAATAALAGLAVVVKFQSFVAGAAALDDMAERTGASVEALSALSNVARVSGVEIATVEGALIRLAKGLAGADEESKGAGNALAALGLKAEELQKLDTADALKLVADRLSEFKDGAGKTALAMDLLGKSGAQALPFLKDLAETTELNARLTASQAAQAELLEKNLVRLSLSTSAAWREFSAAVMPTVAAFVQALLDAQRETGGLRDEVKRLGNDGTIGRWAESVAIGVAYVVDVLQAAVKSIGVLRAEVSLLAAGAELAIGKLQTRATESPIVIETRLKNARAAFDNALKDVANRGRDLVDFTPFSEKLKKQLELQRNIAAGIDAGGDVGLRGKKSLDTYRSNTGATGAATKAKDELKSIQTYVEQIREQLIGVTEGEFEKMRAKVRDVFGKVDFAGLSGADQKKFSAALAQVNEDINKLEERARGLQLAKVLGESFDLATAAANRTSQAFAGFNDAMKESERSMQFELDMVGKLASERQRLTMLRKIDADAARAAGAVDPGASNSADTIAQIYAAADSAKARVIELDEQIRTKSRDGFEGLASAGREYFDRISNSAANFGQAFNGVMGSLENSFAKFAETGKFEFKSLVSSIVADIARIQIRENITGPIAKAIGGGGGLSSLFGRLFGGGGDPMAGTLGFADGGRPPMGRMSMVGERGPELFIPDSAGTIIPNHALGGTSYNFNIDARGADAGVEARIQQAVKTAVSLSVSAVASQANRGGSYARSVGRR